MRRIVVMLFLLCAMGAVQAGGGLDIYFVRHAETQRNATGESNSGNYNTFSSAGVEQVNMLTNKLKTMHFDAILVSPAPRALNTILPYLKETGQKAVIWPELTECCWQQDRGSIAEGQLTPGSPIELSDEQKEYFTFRDANSMRNYGNRSYADGIAQSHYAENLLRQHYFGSGKTILIVGHYHAGQVLLADLLDVTRYNLPGLKNAKLTHLRQGEDGRFTLLSINSEEVTF
jgi:broad specificity phosphatase PhoE